MLKPVRRTLNLKFIHYADGRRKDFSPLTAQAMVLEIQGGTKNLGERLWHPDGETGKHFFINRVRDHDGAACSFQVCSYLPGAMPSGALPDPAESEVDIQTIPVVDPKTAKPVEIMTVMHVLAFGQVMIVENVQGAGGVHAVAAYLTTMVRRLRNDKAYPSMRLLDVANADLRKTIERGGGVESMQLSLVESPPEVSDGKFARMLGDAHKSVGDARRVVISWEGMGTLDTDDVVDAYSEFSDEHAFDGVILHLKHGGAISDWGKYRESIAVDIAARGPGTPHSDAVVTAMREYLIELQTPKDGYRVVTDDGALAPGVAAAHD